MPSAAAAAAGAALDEDSGVGGSVDGSDGEDSDSMPDVNAQQISNSYFVNLDVSVLEVRGG